MKNTNKDTRPLSSFSVVKLQRRSEVETKVTRKQALKKMGDYGKYAALTALGTYILLDPKRAQASSTPEQPGSGGDFPV